MRVKYFTKVLVCAGFFLTAALQAQASESHLSSSLRVSGIGVFQKDSRNSFSGMLTYNPKLFSIGSSLGISLELGGTALRSSLGSKSIFPVGSAKAYLGLAVDKSLVVEVGGGAQMWVDNGDLIPVAGANFVKPNSSRAFGLFKLFFAGYTAGFVSNNLTHEVQIGVGI